MPVIPPIPRRQEQNGPATPRRTDIPHQSPCLFVILSPSTLRKQKDFDGTVGVKVGFSVGDVLDLAVYQDGFFDFVFDGHCLHCIIGRDRKRMFGAVRRVLKPCGYFLVDTMCGPVDASQLPGYEPESRSTVHGDIASRYLGMPDDILGEIAAAGFRIVRWEINHTDGEPNDMLLVEALSP